MDYWFTTSKPAAGVQIQALIQVWFQGWECRNNPLWMLLLSQSGTRKAESSARRFTHGCTHIQLTPRLLFFTGEFKRKMHYFPTPSLENRMYRYGHLSIWCSCYRKYSDVSEVRENKMLTILSNAGLRLNRQQAPFWICISGKCGDTLQKSVALTRWGYAIALCHCIGWFCCLWRFSVVQAILMQKG